MGSRFKKLTPGRLVELGVGPLPDELERYLAELLHDCGGRGDEMQLASTLRRELTFHVHLREEPQVDLVLF